MESKSPEGVRLPSVSPPPLPGDTPDAYSGAGESKEDVLPTKPATAAPPSPKIGAVQIVEVVSEKQFRLNEEALWSVLRKAPDGMPVAIVSVVGAFRTGKSFLLDFFLRFLTTSEEHKEDGSYDWVNSEGALGGHVDDASGFRWRAGRERQTTGIWLWNRPFIRKLPNSGDEVAVFLLDTQGMFDSETSQMMTACIFGLSTMISSYQVFNVKDRVKEDDLQHLALFSEYGRMGTVHVAETEAAAAGSSEPVWDRSHVPTEKRPPFQTLEFLVRDAPFHKKIQCSRDQLPGMVEEMNKYFETVLSKTQYKDLKATREQISACFDRLMSFELPHPGFDVAEDPDYDGSIELIRKEFNFMIRYYVERLFQENLVPKLICGRKVTALEIRHFISSYAKLFEDGSYFPEATDLLTATAEANNRSAKELALQEFRKAVQDIVGPGKPFLHDSKLQTALGSRKAAAIDKFTKLATFGSLEGTKKYQEELEAEIASEVESATAKNKEKDVFRSAKSSFVLLFFGIVLFGVTGFVLKTMQSVACYPIGSVCLVITDWMINLYALVFFVLLGIVSMYGFGTLHTVWRLVRVFAANIQAASLKEKAD